MPFVPVDEALNVPVANVEGDPSPDPHDPPGTLEGLVLWLADWFARIRDTFWWIGDYIDDVPFVGDALAYPFVEIGDVFDGIQRGVRSWSPTARDIDSKLHDLLTIEGLIDSFAAVFFEDKAPLEWVTDAITDWYDKYIQPVIDGVTDNVGGFYNYVDNAIDSLEIPDWLSLEDGASGWLRDQLYKLLPWGDDPDASMIDEAAAWFGDQLEAIPWISEVKTWWDDVTGDVKDILDDPLGWLGRNLEGAFKSMLAVAGMPLIRAIGEFVNRMLDSTEDE